MKGMINVLGWQVKATGTDIGSGVKLCRSRMKTQQRPPSRVQNAFACSYRTAYHRLSGQSGLYAFSAALRDGDGGVIREPEAAVQTASRLGRIIQAMDHAPSVFCFRHTTVPGG